MFTHFQTGHHSFCVFRDSCVCAFVVYLFISYQCSNSQFTLIQETSYVRNDKSKNCWCCHNNLQSTPLVFVRRVVPISLLSDKVNDMEKKAVVSSLKVCEHCPTSFPIKRHGGTFGMSVFPVLNITTTLVPLIGLNSWYIFNLLNIDAFLLDEPVEEWNTSETYCT